MKIKVCGMREPGNISQVADLKPDYMGFIFYPGSKRYAGGMDEQMIAQLPSGIKKTGVFVDASFADIMSAVTKYELEAVQLHGDETPELCASLKKEGLEVIKAFGIAGDSDFLSTGKYEGNADYFLFDTKTASHGGSGKVFDWDTLAGYAGQTEYFLSGGLSLENIKDIQHIEDKRLYAIDINSKFESEPGVKEVEKVKQAINYIRLKEK